MFTSFLLTIMIILKFIFHLLLEISGQTVLIYIFYIAYILFKLQTLSFTLMKKFQKCLNNLTNIIWHFLGIQRNR